MGTKKLMAGVCFVFAVALLLFLVDAPVGRAGNFISLFFFVTRPTKVGEFKGLSNGEVSRSVVAYKRRHPRSFVRWFLRCFF